MTYSCFVDPYHGSKLNLRVNNRFMRSTCVKQWTDVASTIVSVGDFSQEIESAVGPEIYGPIFRAGLLLFGSGLVSVVIASAIISKSGSWEELALEFDKGKESQLIEGVPDPDDKKITPKNEPVKPSEVSEDIKYLDL